MKPQRTKVYFRLFLALSLVLMLGLPSLHVNAYTKLTYVDPISGLEKTYVCYVLLEPVRPGSSESKVLASECSQDSHKPSFDLHQQYLIARYFDDTNFKNVLIYYYGPALCSSDISYAVKSLEEAYNNKFSSGSGYSGCNNISVFDLTSFGGDSYSCFANCSSFGALNDRVSSWKITN